MPELTASNIAEAIAPRAAQDAVVAIMAVLGESPYWSGSAAEEIGRIVSRLEPEFLPYSVGDTSPAAIAFWAEL